MKIYPWPLKFTIEELEYIINAVDQFDIEYQPAPKELIEKLLSCAERNGIVTNLGYLELI